MLSSNPIAAMRNLGLVLIIVSLIFAWLTVLYRYILKVNESKVNTHYLVKAHIDYVLMGILLILFSIIDNGAPSWLIISTCIGAITNPLLFVFMAFMPKINKATSSPFGIFSTLSFALTTIGFGGLCICYLGS